MPLLLEQFRTFTALGIRFWDPAREAQIADGLRVTIRPMSNPTQAPLLAFQTASGAYAFQRLPGLRRWENGELAADSPLTEIAFVVAVTDTRLRYLPATFRVDLPLPYPGLYRPGGEAASPLEDVAATHFYLFSAPSRTSSSGMAVIRAQLLNADNGLPAAFALVVVSSATESWFGLSAENGSTAVIFPYPTFSKSLGGDSPLSLASEQQWPLTVRIYYQPEVLEFLFDYQVPELHSIRRQAQASLFPILGGPAEDEQQIQLSFEQETVLASDGLSHLLITPAPASP